MMHLRPAAFLACLVLVAGCAAQGRTWQDPPPGAAAPANRAVVVAPVAVGSLAVDWPEAPLRLAGRLAQDITLRVRDADGWVGAALPDGADPAWNGRRAGAAAAYLVVLGRITSLSDLPPDGADRGGVRRSRAQAELIGVDAAGAVVFRRSATGEGTDAGHAKEMGPMNLPRSRAAWDALGNALPALRSFLEQRPDAPPPPSTPLPADGISVAISSSPPQADILVDGRFAGSTPLTIALPAAGARVRLERPGYRPWERLLTPTPGMVINPVLEKAP